MVYSYEAEHVFHQNKICTIILKLKPYELTFEIVYERVRVT